MTAMESISQQSYPCVGTVGRGEFAADWVGPGGRPILFSGAVRVHRIGQLESPDRQFVFECYGKGWAGGYLDDPSSARWYDSRGNLTTPLATPLPVGIATESDYYRVILPALRKLERSLSAEADPAELTPVRVGLVDCWQYR